MTRKPKGTSAAKSATKIEAAGSVPDVPSKLAEAISNKRCAVFVGAGLSTRAGYPSWAKLLERLITKCGETAGRSQAQMDELRELAKRPDRYLMLAQEISDILEQRSGRKAKKIGLLRSGLSGISTIGLLADLLPHPWTRRVRW